MAGIGISIVGRQVESSKRVGKARKFPERITMQLWGMNAWWIVFRKMYLCVEMVWSKVTMILVATNLMAKPSEISSLFDLVAVE